MSESTTFTQAIGATGQSQVPSSEGQAGSPAKPWAGPDTNIQDADWYDALAKAMNPNYEMDKLMGRDVLAGKKYDLTPEAIRYIQQNGLWGTYGRMTLDEIFKVKPDWIMQVVSSPSLPSNNNWAQSLKNYQIKTGVLDPWGNPIPPGGGYTGPPTQGPTYPGGQ